MDCRMCQGTGKICKTPPVAIYPCRSCHGTGQTKTVSVAKTITLTAISFEDLVKQIDRYRVLGYDLETVWYTTRWVFWLYYHAKLNQPKPTVQIDIGPISTRGVR